MKNCKDCFWMDWLMFEPGFKCVCKHPHKWGEYYQQLLKKYVYNCKEYEEKLNYDQRRV